MDRVIALAKKLGSTIGETDRFKRLREAEKALEEDEGSRKLLADLEALQHELAEKQVDGKPIEPEEKHRLADLQASVHGSEALQNLAKAQADYMELMNQVNRTLRGELGVEGDVA